MGARPDAAPVPPVQRLRLVGRHVDAGRAVGRAALARQAQVEHVVQRGGPPAVRPEPAADDLLQHPGPPARGVLLLTGRQVGGAHDAARPGVVGAALADSRAPVHGARQVPAVVPVGETQVALVGDGTHRPQIVVHGSGADDDARVEHVVGVEDVLDPRAQRQRLGRVHVRQQLAARPAVAVLAGHGAVVPGRQRRRLAQEPANNLLPSGRPKGKSMRTWMIRPRNAVRDAVQPVLGQQRLELPQVRAEPLGRHRRVLPAGVGLLALGGARDQPGPVLADPPQRVGERRVLDHGRSAQPESRATARAASRSAPSRPANSTSSHPEPRGSGGTAPGPLRSPHDAVDPRVQPLARHGPVRQDRRGPRRRPRPSTRTPGRPADGARARGPSAPAPPGSRASVPSLPTSARATSKPFSGSRCSRE